MARMPSIWYKRICEMINSPFYRSFEHPLAHSSQRDVTEDSSNPSVSAGSGGAVALPTLTVGILTPLGVISVVAAEQSGASVSGG